MRARFRRSKHYVKFLSSQHELLSHAWYRKIVIQAEKENYSLDH